ncbi:MAG: universal stress protein [Deltaproteobacteria bacterium]|nr:universal stress protein [Deltaproteobacteria bacterium]
MVPQINRILFATDLTENSRRAFYYAATIANLHGAGMVILHVLEKLPGGAKQTIDLMLGEETSQRFREAREKHVQNVLIGKRRDDDIVRRALAEFYSSAVSGGLQPSFDSYDVLIEEGQVPDEIVRVAAEQGCDLIVMGSHKGLLHSTALGSAAKGVVQHSKVPVLLVPPAEEV